MQRGWNYQAKHLSPQNHVPVAVVSVDVVELRVVHAVRAAKAIETFAKRIDRHVETWQRSSIQTACTYASCCQDLTVPVVPFLTSSCR